MNGIINTWSTLTPVNRVILVLSVLATLAVVGTLAKVANQPALSLLYAGLDNKAAGMVVERLDQMNAAYEIRGNSIYVDDSARDRIRLTMAGEGLPQQGQSGYELLDGLTGFGTTAEMFDATYWRAKEGELARTILSLPEISEARVHIAAERRKAFSRSSAPASASITLSTSGGFPLAVRQATAVRYLVALAVPGLSPNDVTVIDTRNGIILKPGEADASMNAINTEEAYKAKLKKELISLLSARVGAGQVQVQLAVKVDRESETISERVIDPDSRIAISSDTEEITEENTGGSGQVVTVASNLPDGDAQGAGGGGSSSRSESRERLNYEISETRRERKKEAGAIRQITVAVLVDGLREVAADGTSNWTPRPQEELDVLTDLVKSAVGFDEARGDQVTVRSLEFANPVVEVGTAPIGGGVLSFFARHLMTLIQLGVLSSVAILLGMFVVKPILTQKPLPVPALSDQDSTGTQEQLALGAGNAEGQNLQITEEVESSRTKLLTAVSEKPDDVKSTLKNWLAVSSSPNAEEAA